MKYETIFNPVAGVFIFIEPGNLNPQSNYFVNPLL